ncbi:hypothetical protein [Streptosporangium sp. NPDC004631]
MTEAALEAPTETVEDVIYPAVPGGYKTLVTPLHGLDSDHRGAGVRVDQHRARADDAGDGADQAV